MSEPARDGPVGRASARHDSSVLSLGVLGGTFDPVHIGHLILGEAAREQLELDRVLFMPANFPWRKADQAITPPEHRLEMLRLAIEDNPAFEVSDVEIVQGGPSYTADTLEELSKLNPGARLFFILGADALRDLPNWRRPERIAELATLAVAGRAGPGGRVSPSLPATDTVRINMPAVDVSASAIRELARVGRSIRYLVPDAVAAYIAEHHLYQ